MVELSTCDFSGPVPVVEVPKNYNAAHDFIDRNIIAGRGGKCALIDDAGRYSYDALFRRVNRAGNAFRALGLERERRIVLCLLDTVDFPSAFYGALKIGAVPIPVNTLLTAEDYRYILADSRAEIVVVTDQLLERMAPALEDQPFLREVIVSGQYDGPHKRLDDLMAAADDRLEAAETWADEPGFWMYSSGTTGRPKGIVHAHSDPVHTAALFGRGILGITEKDRIFSAAKLFFAYGLGNAMTFPFYFGATSVLMLERPTPKSVTERLITHQPSVYYGVPTLYGTMLADSSLDLEQATANMRLCVSAGEALPRELGLRWKERTGIEVLDGIGSTEMMQTFLSNSLDDLCYGTTGRAVPGYELKLVDEDMKPVAAGEVGELLVRGPSMAIGYWNRRPQSRHCFMGEWFRTGDKFHQDSDGHYIYAGRADDMLKVGGIWVSPFEIEAKLVEHEAVLEAAVIGCADHDEMIKPKAFVILNDPAQASKDLADEIKQFIKTHLAPFKYPRWVEFVSELPKTATGKIQRYKLRG